VYHPAGASHLDTNAICVLQAPLATSFVPYYASVEVAHILIDLTRICKACATMLTSPKCTSMPYAIFNTYRCAHTINIMHKLVNARAKEHQQSRFLFDGNGKE
jgi:hypothetical protein